MPAGGEDRARAFYAGVLGMTEVPEPRGACEAAGFHTTPGEPLDGRPRAYVHDPFGNRIELIQTT